MLQHMPVSLLVIFVLYGTTLVSILGRYSVLDLGDLASCNFVFRDLAVSYDMDMYYSYPSMQIR